MQAPSTWNHRSEICKTTLLSNEGAARVPVGALLILSVMHNAVDSLLLQARQR